MSAHRAKETLKIEPSQQLPPPAPIEPVTPVTPEVVTALTRWNPRPSAVGDLLRRAAADDPDDPEAWAAALVEELPGYFTPSTGGNAGSTSPLPPPPKRVQFMTPRERGENLDKIASGEIR